jgi:hypothetical protein
MNDRRIMLVAVAAILISVLHARSEDLSEISVGNASYCALYSREMVFIEMMHGDDMVVADTDYILKIAQGHYGDCLAVLPTLLPLPEETGSLRSWLADIRDLMVLTGRKKVIDIGTVPAVDKKPDPDEEWRRQCRAEYSTWEEETGTVVRRGSPERVRCPCGTEIQCVY